MLPLNQLRDALVREGIADRDNIKVLDKASVRQLKFIYLINFQKISLFLIKLISL